MLLRAPSPEKADLMSERDKYTGAFQQPKALHPMHPMRLFSLTQDGRLKSTRLMYAFSYAMVLAAIYAAAYFFLLGPVNALTEGLMPIQLVNAIQSLIPALTGTAIGIVPQLLRRGKGLVPGAYAILDIMILPIALTAVMSMNAADRPAFISLMFSIAGLPALIGTFTSFIIYRKQKQTEGKQHATHNR